MQNVQRMLTRYNAWANQLIFDAVANLATGEATQEQQNLFDSIVRALNHNYIIDLIWKAHLEGYEHGFKERNPKDHPLLDELWPLQQKIDHWYIKLSDTISPEKLDEKVNFTLMGGDQGVMRRSEILLHVVNHTTYHRGFIADMFYQIPVKPPATDLPVFLRNYSVD